MVAAVTGFLARSRLRPHGGPAASRRYERRRPEKTPLHKIISENLESWLAWREAAERPVPAYVDDELRGYLECGLLCFGFARAVCMSCRTGFVVAFSCKGRGVCPSCNGRHMTQTAAHLADHVIPPVPVRQWVISVPKRLRGMLADRPRAIAALTKIFLDDIERTLITASGVTAAADTPSASRPRLGGISFLHRFGSALNHHVHLHACVTDGVFVPAADDAGCDAPPAFLPARAITPADLAELTERVRRRVIRWFQLARCIGMSWNEGSSKWGALFEPVRVETHHPIFNGFPERLALSDEFYWDLNHDDVEVIRDPRPRRPDRPHPLRAAQTQGRQLGRARPRPQVHAAGGQWRRRAHAV